LLCDIAIAECDDEGHAADEADGEPGKRPREAGEDLTRM
jgi:hypothetical protein